MESTKNPCIYAADVITAPAKRKEKGKKKQSYRKKTHILPDHEGTNQSSMDGWLELDLLH
jgi:hypothetical protein